MPPLIFQTGALSDTVERARQYGRRAIDALAMFPASRAKSALIEAVEFAVARAYEVNMKTSRPALYFFAATAFISTAANAAQLTVNKSPYCGCCAKWIEHVQQHGFTVKVVDTEDMGAVKQRLGVPPTDWPAAIRRGRRLLHRRVCPLPTSSDCSPEARQTGIAVPEDGRPARNGNGRQALRHDLVRSDGTTGVFARH